MRLIQFREGGQRFVARVEGPRAHVIAGVNATRELAGVALREGSSLEQAATRLGIAREVDYSGLLANGQVLPPIDHPDGAHCLVTGTGLTHVGGAAARNEMHKKADAATGNETDSIKMFNLGLKGGKP
jgi:hypothetical protein